MSQLAVPRSESTHQRLYEFSRTALVKIFAHPYATVCELFCGGGLDADKWDDAQIGHYMGIDVSSSGINQIREAWESQRKAYTAEFFELDPCSGIQIAVSAAVEQPGLDVDGIRTSSISSNSPHD